MAETSPVGLALFAFRRRDKRFVLTSASIAYVIGSLALGAAFLAVAWPALSAMMSWHMEVMRSVADGGEPPAFPRGELLQGLIGIAPYYAAFLLLSLLLFAAYEAACLRWFLRGERGGVLGLTLGADTWRVFATYLIWFALGLGFAVFIGAFYAGFIALSSAAPQALRVLMMLLGALAPLALAALAIWGAVRLSPAAAASVARRRFAFFDAWAATRGRFWELLGAFVILLAVYLGVGFILSALVRAPMLQAMYPALSDVTADASFDAILERMREAFLSPWAVVSMGAYALAATVLAMLLYVGWFGVNAAVFAAPEPQAAPARTQPPEAPASPPSA